MTYITTPEFNTMAASVFNARLAQANLVSKTDFDNRVSSLDSKIAVNKTKNESIENELKKLKTFDANYFRGKSHFKVDGTENYLYFSQYTNILNWLQIQYIFHHGNLKDYLMKSLNLLLRLIIAFFM